MDKNLEIKMVEMLKRIEKELSYFLDFYNYYYNENYNIDKNFSWINVDKYIDFLKPFINTFNVDKKTNQFYVKSVALNSGIIYFSPYVLGIALTQYMNSIGKKPFNYKNKKDREGQEGCLNYISKILYENGQLARVNSGFYSNSVQVIFENGHTLKGFGILINFEVFGFNSISESTGNMPDELKGIKDVVIIKEKIKEPIDIFSWWNLSISKKSVYIL